MRRAIAIREELKQIHTVEELTEVFESVASVKIARIRNRVVESKDYFAELWQTYRSLRLDKTEKLHQKTHKTGRKQALVAVTTEGKLGGDISNKVIDQTMAAIRNNENTDLIVLGTHGAEQLQQSGVMIAKIFHLPESDTVFHVTDMIEVLEQYEKISVIYQTYESLRIQRVATIELASAVKELTKEVEATEDKSKIISSHDYIFEPGITEIADYLESLMLGVALTQILMESKLSQHASRFNAMNAAKHRANDMYKDYFLQYHRAKRAESDERLKEIMNVVKGQKV